MALLNPANTEPTAQKIFDEFVNSDFGKQVIARTKYKYPEYKSEPGEDTTGELLWDIMEEIEDNHIRGYEDLRDFSYAPNTVITFEEFHHMDESGGSVKHSIENKLTGMLLN